MRIVVSEVAFEPRMQRCVLRDQLRSNRIC